MKFNRYIYGVVAGALLAGSTVSCTNDFEEINTDPNKMVLGDLNAYGVFEAMFYGMGKRQCYLTWAYSNELVQFTACTGSNGKDFHRYSFNNNNIETVWNNYAQYAANADHMIQQSIKKDEPAAQAVGLTLKVFCMSNLTDIFGDIPYREAFKGSEGITAPEFDSQKDVYEQMFADLEAANTLYSKSPVWAKPGIDLMYGGDMSLWRKFNNSIYLRLLMRVSGRAEMNAAAKIQEIVSSPSKYPIISSNAESATIKNTGLDPYYNYFRPSDMTKVTFSSGSYKLTHTLVGLTVRSGADSEEDPRLATMAYKFSSSGDWTSVQGGCSLSDVRVEDTGASYLNYEVLVRDAAPVWLFDYSEIQFILAEAALKGYISGGEAAARSYYEAAITSSCKKWNDLVQYSSRQFPISDAKITAFLSGNLAGWDNNADHVALIANQKFLSLFWVGFEAYHELRRTGYPIITIGNGCSYNNFEYVQRLYYPTNTVGSNNAHVQEALDRMGGDNSLRTPVWWSYQAINGTFTAVRQN